MTTFLEKLLIINPYVISVILFFIGTLIILTQSNLFKKLLGINVMETATFLMFIAAGNIRGGAVPILSDTHAPYINPLPSALMLTGIVVSISVTAFALALILRLYREYGTVDANEIARLRNGGMEK